MNLWVTITHFASMLLSTHRSMQSPMQHRKSLYSNVRKKSNNSRPMKIGNSSKHLSRCKVLLISHTLSFNCSKHHRCIRYRQEACNKRIQISYHHYQRCLHYQPLSCLSYNNNMLKHRLYPNSYINNHISIVAVLATSQCTQHRLRNNNNSVS